MDMNNKIMNAWEWTKKNKTKIIVAGCAGVAAVCGVILFKNSKNQVVTAMKDVFDSEWRPEKINILDLGVGKLDDALKYPDGTVELWLDNIPLADMGALGDAIAAEISSIPGDNNVWALLSVKPNVIE